jgi:hypothetical protein
LGGRSNVSLLGCICENRISNQKQRVSFVYTQCVVSFSSFFYEPLDCTILKRIDLLEHRSRNRLSVSI